MPGELCGVLPLFLTALIDCGFIPLCNWLALCSFGLNRDLLIRITETGRGGSGAPNSATAACVSAPCFLPFIHLPLRAVPVSVGGPPDEQALLISGRPQPRVCPLSESPLLILPLARAIPSQALD